MPKSMGYAKNPMDGKPTKPNTNHPSFFKMGKVMEGAAMYEGGLAKGASIGVAPRGKADGGVTKPVKIASDYAEHLKKEWQKAKGYEK